ncbi:hypothetical protein MAR_ORF421 [Marseillevirus marseillevirus]|uniref:Uncharacterized protein n=1 Tax=Marseillevirus marseillevirus TaxID=694581 RepID=D2XB56_GBMV|nr:hypothetical protein MAR_ORF421 [Marseillevirus marseillevirus]YP_009094877.1 hypothetical protein MEL_376 [Melbournevirus]ADB04183.1 hypothetical protein MAR_ORF421 [Marseillevirus marseillevirus]AIT54989.1 hypothetical protein MEL_376 [Melbournevirus]AVR53143.1 hypothetical protein MarSH_438 [Marseillevirus Shanghai 1]
MATKTILADNLCVVDSEDTFLLTIDGGAVARITGKQDAEKAVIVIVEKIEGELKNASTSVYREKIDGGFSIFTRSLGYLVNGSPVQRHIVKYMSLPSLIFEMKEEETPKVEIPVPPPAPEVPQKKLPETPKQEPQKEEIFVGPYDAEKLIPYNTVGFYEPYASAH